MSEYPEPQSGGRITFHPRTVRTSGQLGVVLGEAERSEFGFRQYRVRWQRTVTRKRKSGTEEVSEPIEELISEDRIISILPQPAPHSAAA